MMVKAWCSWERDREREREGKHIDDENIYIENKCIIHSLSLIHAITRPTWGAGVSDEILGEANLEGEPSKKWEQSVYADPMPNPAPKATDAQRVTGLPSLNLRLLIWEGYKHQLKNQQTITPVSKMPEPKWSVNEHAKKLSQISHEPLIWYSSLLCHDFNKSQNNGDVCYLQMPEEAGQIFT